MLDAFINRYAASQGKDQQGNDKAPEKDFLPVTERMFIISRFFALIDPDQQEESVAGVNQGVDPLGKHCRGSGEQCRDEFADRDRTICYNCAVDRFF